MLRSLLRSVKEAGRSRDMRVASPEARFVALHAGFLEGRWALLK